MATITRNVTGRIFDAPPMCCATSWAENVDAVAAATMPRGVVELALAVVVQDEQAQGRPVLLPAELEQPPNPQTGCQDGNGQVSRTRPLITIEAPTIPASSYRAPGLR